MSLNPKRFDIRHSTFDGNGGAVEERLGALASRLHAKFYAFIASKRRLLDSKTVERRTSILERRASRGFNMVEVSLAIAVVGLAMVSILGLLAVGLDAGRDAGDDNMASTLLQAVIADRRSTPYHLYTPNSATPTTPTETTFSIPPLDASAASWPYILYFKKFGGTPVITNALDIGKPKTGYYYEIDMMTNSAAPPNLAILDMRVSWPANVHLTNRTAYYYTTAFSKRTP